MLSPHREIDLSLIDALGKRALPTLLQVSRDCKLRGEAVLYKGQVLTVLDRHYVDLIVGFDWNGQNFRLNTNIVKDYLLDTVNELYPGSIEEVKSLVTCTDFIQVKRPFEDKYGTRLKRYEKIVFCTFLDTDAQNIVLKTERDERICIDTSELVNKNYFVFVKVKETIKVQSLLRSFEPQTVCFKDEINGDSIPLGNVTLNTVSTHDVIFTVSVRNKGYELMYETFSVDKRIRVNLLNKEIPKHVEILGQYNSEQYQEKLTEVNFLMFYQIFSPRYYGHLKVENYLYDTQSFREYASHPSSPPSKSRRPLNLDFSSRRKTKTRAMFSSVRRGLERVLLKHSPRDESYRFDQKKSDAKNSVLGSPQKENVYTPGVYTPIHDTVRQRSLSENESVVYRSNAELATFCQKTLQASENCMYGMMDTITLNEIKKLNTTKVNETPSNKNVITSKELDPVDLTRRIPAETFRSISQQKIDQEFFFHPTFPAQENPVEKPTKSNFNEKAKYQRSPSLPVRKQRPNILPKAKSLYESNPVLPTSNQAATRPNSSPSVALPPGNEGGVDSGIDSPEVKKNQEQISNEFLTRYDKEKESKKVECVNISPPYNFQHLTSLTTHESDNLYKIPNSNQNNISSIFNNRDSIDLDGLISITTNHNLARSKSEPLLNDQIGRTASTFQQPPIYEDVKYEEVKGRDWDFVDSSQRRELSSLKEIKSYSIPKVVELLKDLGLEKHIDSFVHQRINGSILVYLSEKEMEDLELTKFESCKLYKHIHGWRPNTNDIQSTEESLDDVNLKRWSVNDVIFQMKTDMNLLLFAIFCEKHQIDGRLLTTLVMKKVLPTLSNDGLRLTDFECKRLRMYVTREVKYTKEDKEFLEKKI